MLISQNSMQAQLGIIHYLCKDNSPFTHLIVCVQYLPDPLHGLEHAVHEGVCIINRENRTAFRRYLY